jgi:hypothetical protein
MNQEKKKMQEPIIKDEVWDSVTDEDLSRYRSLGMTAIEDPDLDVVTVEIVGRAAVTQSPYRVPTQVNEALAAHMHNRYCQEGGNITPEILEQMNADLKSVMQEASERGLLYDAIETEISESDAQKLAEVQQMLTMCVALLHDTLGTITEYLRRIHAHPAERHLEMGGRILTIRFSPEESEMRIRIGVPGNPFHTFIVTEGWTREGTVRMYELMVAPQTRSEGVFANQLARENTSIVMPQLVAVAFEQGWPSPKSKDPS